MLDTCLGVFQFQLVPVIPDAPPSDPSRGGKGACVWRLPSKYTTWLTRCSNASPPPHLKQIPTSLSFSPPGVRSGVMIHSKNMFRHQRPRRLHDVTTFNPCGHHHTGLDHLWVHRN